VYRVNWMRAKSRRDRWQEEVSITSHEMVWIVLWFQGQAGTWARQAESGDTFPSLVSYAYRQAATWNKLKRLAAFHFHQVHHDFSAVFGYGTINPE
jgi:hypothetical protein